MLKRKLKDLSISKSLSKGPSLVRSKSDFIIQHERHERPWPTGKSPEASQIREIWQHPNRNFTVPITIYNVPNNSTAYERWPTLKRFMPALNPRALKTVKPGGGYDVSVDEQLALMPYMYHDLGVMVYDGPDEEQLQVIGNILQKVAKHECRLQGREWGLPQHANVRYDKWNVYRLPVDEKLHLDSLSDPQKRGLLHPRGLDELTDMAVSKWREAWRAGREAEGRDGRVPVRFIKNTKSLWLLRNKEGMGLINETINGPRTTSVDAYVATAIYHKIIWMNVELHTVGTKRFLGCASYQFEANVDHDIREKRLKEAMEMHRINPNTLALLTRSSKEERLAVQRILPKIYSREAPATIERQEPVVADVTRKMWNIERKIWAKE